MRHKGVISQNRRVVYFVWVWVEEIVYKKHFIGNWQVHQCYKENKNFGKRFLSVRPQAVKKIKLNTSVTLIDKLILPISSQHDSLPPPVEGSFTCMVSGTWNLSQQPLGGLPCRDKDSYAHWIICSFTHSFMLTLPKISPGSLDYQKKQERLKDAPVCVATSLYGKQTTSGTHILSHHTNNHRQQKQVTSSEALQQGKIGEPGWGAHPPRLQLHIWRASKTVPRLLLVSYVYYFP